MPEQAAQQQVEQTEPEIHGYDDCYRIAGTLIYDDCLSKENAVSPRPSDAPQRVIDAAAQMLARVGLNATSIREVTKLAEAPLGSTYHHFPGGKRVAGARHPMAGDKVEALLMELLEGGAVQGLQQFLAMWRERLLRSDFRAGCPVLAAAVEEPVEATPSQPRRRPRCSRAGTAISPRRSSLKGMPRQRRVNWPAW